MNTNQKGGMAASYASGGQYGFSDKVVDGITLTVNSVLLTLKSRAFIASFQVSLFLVFFWFVGSVSYYVTAAVVRCAQVLYTENRQRLVIHSRRVVTHPTLYYQKYLDKCEEIMLLEFYLPESLSER